MSSNCYRWLVGSAVLALAACPTRDISQLQMSPAIELRKEIPVKTNRNVDILFVVDNSDSMADKQAHLVENFPGFIRTLAGVPGGRPSMQIAVVSSDVGIDPYMGDACSGNGDDGKFQSTPHGNCKGPNGNWIVDTINPDGVTRNTNYTGDLAATFTCIAALGTSGCGFEQHLESMKRSLDGSQPANAGFLRDDAYLAVVVLADEDDCSARDHSLFDSNPALDNINSVYGINASFRCTEFGVKCDGSTIARAPASYLNCTPRGDSYLYDPAYYYTFLLDKKKDPNLLVAAVIAGPHDNQENASHQKIALSVSLNARGEPQLDHSCSYQGGVADPAIRLQAFSDMFGEHGQFTSICIPDYSVALDKLAKLLERIIGTPCLEGPIDVTDINPQMPGLQLDCQVSDVRFPHTPTATETVLPRCNMIGPNEADKTVLPCWWTAIDDTACSAVALDSPTHVALHVERGGGDAPTGTSVVAKCVSQ
jgi:hypothetical protein